MPTFVDHIVVVDDGSTDNTSKVTDSAGDKRVEVIRHRSNMGLGQAIATGHQRAITLDSQIIVVMAGDGQMDPKYLPRLLDALVEEGYDYAKGNRFIEMRGLLGMPRIRVVGNALLSFLTKIASGYWSIFDPQNGYTALRVAALKRINLERISKGYNFENDMLVELNVAGCHVKDVAMPALYASEQSKIRLIPFTIKTIFLLFRRFHSRIYRKYILYDFHPYALLYLSGTLLLTWALVFSSYLIYSRYFAPEHSSPSSGTVMLAAVPLFIGIQLLLTAFLVDLEESRRLTQEPTMMTRTT